eukprot:3215933-Rhodomonas_salina.1
MCIRDRCMLSEYMRARYLSIRLHDGDSACEAMSDTAMHRGLGDLRHARYHMVVGAARITWLSALRVSHGCRRCAVSHGCRRCA